MNEVMCDSVISTLQPTYTRPYEISNFDRFSSESIDEEHYATSMSQTMTIDKMASNLVEYPRIHWLLPSYN